MLPSATKTGRDKRGASPVRRGIRRGLEGRMQPIAGIEDVETGLSALLAEDPSLAEVAAIAGPLPLRLSEPGFAGLAHIVVAQMVSRASADAIWRRLQEEAGEITPHHILGLTEDSCRRIGLSRAKSATLRLVAEAVDRGDIDLDAVCHMEAEVAVRILTQLKGIGRWTAEVYLLFCAGHPDIFPSGDVALQNAVAHALGLRIRPSVAELDRIAEAWAPWRGISARLFWAYYAREMRREVAPVLEK